VWLRRLGRRARAAATRNHQSEDKRERRLHQPSESQQPDTVPMGTSWFGNH
jgi:hypothetical protein